MKKIVLSTVAAAALIAAPFTTGKANAAGLQPVNTKVVYYQVNLSDSQDWYKILNQYNIDLNQFFNYQQAPPSNTQKQPVPAQPAQKPVQQPTQKVQKPVQQQPVQKPAQQQAKPATQASSQLNAFEQQVVDLTNQERAKNGLAPLKVDIELSKVAREKSRDMSANHYFDHTSPTYGSPFDMMKKFGITYRSAGENIAMGQQTPQEVVKAWMNSEGHRANILNSSYTHIGVGYVANGNYWTQQFIGK
ncbi:CAP domain-containing protein [Lederbergia wuyishanensis]|uniref:YkwD family protein n=1 Tax=Lederbergia wuyishanensis TaxID=1347903 RepID=A0ABU0D0P0_9BACI|nr:CAP domain-containing protein [Lederbergia wuyishanensis]MCJ8006592.1 CAP domain-containing protein [Lederbergia wuyishanensis]MDQ0341973.1 putative YkwD family protein [Lederbergia wuyishanensis]